MVLASKASDDLKMIDAYFFNERRKNESFVEVLMMNRIFVFVACNCTREESNFDLK